MGGCCTCSKEGPLGEDGVAAAMETFNVIASSKELVHPELPKRRLSGLIQQEVRAQYMEREELEALLVVHLAECEEFKETALRCLDMIINGVGGAIIMVLREDIIGNDLQLEPLDGGILYKVMQSIAKNTNEDRKNFKKMLDALTARSATDRWEHADIVDLTNQIEGTPKELVRKLDKQPKDGALLISHTGDVRGACLHIKYKSKNLVLKMADGTSAGTRHASSLGMAEWLGTMLRPGMAFPGVVFTRSDGGGGHAFIPQRGKAPNVVNFKSLHHLSQEEMFALFRDRIKANGVLMLKTEPTLIRKGVKGEQVVTVVGGRVTSDFIINNDTSYVVQAPTVDQEYYVLPKEKFLRHYLPDGIELDEGDHANSFMKLHFKHLRERGFKLYTPRPNSLRCVYTLTAQDLLDMGIPSFQASWGAIQPVRVGDRLASIAPLDQAKEIYLMPPEVIATYRVYDGQGPGVGSDSSLSSIVTVWREQDPEKGGGSSGSPCTTTTPH